MSRFKGDESIKKVGKKTFLYTVNTTVIAASVACVLYYLISPGNLEISAVNTSHHTGVQGADYLGYLNTIIPSNIFAPFIEHHVMGVLLISMVLGISIAFLPEEAPCTVITNFFKGAHGMFIVITSWIVKIIPLALFGFITTTLVQMKSSANISGLAGYLLVVVLANFVQGGIVLPVFLHINGIKAFSAMKGMFPALSVAFFSKSSAGTLPVTINTMEKNLNVSPKISRLVLPLCTSINMNGCAAFYFYNSCLFDAKQWIKNWIFNNDYVDIHFYYHCNRKRWCTDGVLLFVCFFINKYERFNRDFRAHFTILQYHRHDRDFSKRLV
ncbi:neutral amino acid transporter A [Holospora undulata HU1]|uniref:Neutral amino acid transporter A n=1 Tax=Holospora undulata HU1 TaxID=1321371 RepID=A0A061JHJ5_9PROT|nr:neutral amino acid transporter A [Holospora undulata HU1]